MLAILGPATSGAFKSEVAVAEKERIPVISGSATADDVTVDENGNVKKYAFRICFADSFQGSAMAEFAFNKLGAKTAVIIRTLQVTMLRVWPRISQQHLQQMAAYCRRGSICCKGHRL